jgi:hypothetical protein
LRNGGLEQGDYCMNNTIRTLSKPAGPLARSASRRGFFQVALKTSLAAAALTALPGSVRRTQALEPGECDDLTVLNYALTLEHLEAAFYVEGLKRFSARSFKTGDLVSRLGPRIAGGIYDYLAVIRDHEVAHVVTLQAVIESLGGVPVSPCTYDFGYNSVETFLQVAQALENTGVMAYDGAIAQICTPELQTAGATIATVEARHAAYLNLVNGGNPFPEAFDTPKTMDEILAIAGQFITSCP